MVIQQFNKLIRNKWLWSVFAIIVGGAFAFDFAIDSLLGKNDDRRASDGSCGMLAGEPVASSLFREIAEDIRGFGQNRDYRRKTSEVNRKAWEMYAMLEIAEKNGICATDADVAAAIRRDPSFQSNGQFSFKLYQRILRDNSLSDERYEAFLKRTLTLSRISDGMLSTASWASPMEIDQAVNDMTDSYTVKVARFAEDAKEADAVKLDEAGLKKWYDDNSKSLDLPERVKLRLVKFDATKPELLAKMEVSDDDMHDRYDVTLDKYTSTDTNGVETVKAFEEVKDEIEKDLRLIAAVQFYETNLNRRVYGTVPAEGVSRLDEIAKEDGLQVTVSDWFTVDGAYRDGFMVRASQVCPDAQNFNEVVAELDPDTADLRYGIVSSDKAVWVVEKAEVSPAHIPTFEEAKEIVRPRALAAAKADAFKTKVEGVIAKGKDAVLASGNVSTNFTFAVCDLKQGELPDQNTIVRAACKLNKGGISGFELTSKGNALVVVCEDRVPGDAAKAQIYRATLRDEVQMLQRRQLPELWRKWNLASLGFETGDGSSIEDVEEE